jgi:hypothetical protein
MNYQILFRMPVLKNLEIKFCQITLTVVTSLKFIMGIVLGLLVQVSGLRACPQAEFQSSHVATQHKHDCCKDMASCPCVKKSHEAPKPIPIVPASNEMRLGAPRLRELDFLADFLQLKTSEFREIAISPPECRCGMTSVSRSVIFCTFVI